MDFQHGRYLISTDKSLLDREAICGFLARSYWANHRTKETIYKSIDNSLCYGIYDGREQIGFARVVTDWATIYYLCDVYIDERYRGQGLGKAIVEVITNDFPDLSGLLGTKDAHGLYEQYGFIKSGERFVIRRHR